MTTATHQLANTSVTSSQSGPSSEYAVIQKPTNKKIPHLTVNSGDKYALSTHVNSLKRVKQQQPTSVHSQVSDDTNMRYIILLTRSKHNAVTYIL